MKRTFTKIKKELLNELGFEQLPTLSKFVLKRNDKGRLWKRKDKGRLWKDILDSIDVIDYTLFITQPLTKGMFIPCDEDGEVINLKYREEYMSNHSMYHTDLKQYQQAKVKVLFKESKGVDFEGNRCFYFMTSNEVGTIEQAINNGVKIELI